MKKQFIFISVLLSSTFLSLLLPFKVQAAFKFISWADTKTATSVLSSLSNQGKTLNPKFTIYPGDLENSGFTQAGMDKWKAAMNGNSNNGMFDITFPVRGNHDSKDSAGWQGYFNLAQTASSIGASNYTELSADLTYSFDVENARIIGIDVTGDANKLSSAQITWLDQRLADAESKGLDHAFIYFHGPSYCIDGHCSCSTVTGCNMAPTAFFDVLNKHKVVSATFHGHEHVNAYTHIDSSRVPPITTLPYEQFVTGDAGAGVDSCKANRTQYCMTGAHGFALIEVSGSTFTVNFYKQGASSPDKTLAFTKTGGTPQPTPSGPSPTPSPTTKPPTPSPTSKPTTPPTQGPTPTKMPSPTPGGKPGDANGDGKVDLLDYVVWLGNLLKSVTGGAAAGDFNNNGTVDGLDFIIWLTNFSGTLPSPTPTSTQPSPTPTRPPGVTNTPTPKPTGPTPTSLPPGSPYRAFSNDSYWNTPFSANAPIDSHNNEYIADSLNLSHTQNYLRFTAAPGTSQGFGQPIFWASQNDKLYTISDGKLNVQVHIPTDARPAPGSDSQITVYDLSTDQAVGMSGASYNSGSDSWSVAGSIDRYMLGSNGLDSRVVGSNDSRNFGHRGITTAVRAVRVDEVRAGAINHRLACFWWATGTQTVNHYWPMAGDEGAKGGIVPEGIVIRIKPGVDLTKRGLSPPALTIAKALQNYGCMIGDNSGAGNRLKLELNESAWSAIGIKENSLDPIPWSDWEFIQGGYKP